MKHILLGKIPQTNKAPLASPDIGLLGVYGSVIVSGVCAVIAAPFISRLLPFFPQQRLVVTRLIN